VGELDFEVFLDVMPCFWYQFLTFEDHSAFILRAFLGCVTLMMKAPHPLKCWELRAQ
jgi:hypothetical protein